MKHKEALAAIRSIGMVATVTDGEWRVAFPLSHYAGQWPGRAMQQARQEAQAAYEYNPDDAVATAKAMKAGDVRDHDAEILAEMIESADAFEGAE